MCKDYTIIYKMEFEIGRLLKNMVIFAFQLSKT